MTSAIVAQFRVKGVKSGKIYQITHRQEFIQVNDPMGRQLVSTGYIEYIVDSHSDHQAWPVYEPMVNQVLNPYIHHFNVLDQKTGFQEECEILEESP
jgi:hypothetical protein